MFINYANNIFNNCFSVKSFLKVVLGDDFIFTNRYSVALCLANQPDFPFSQIQTQLFGPISNGIENVPFNHNVRSTLLSAGIYVLYSSGKVSNTIFYVGSLLKINGN